MAELVAGEIGRSAAERIGASPARKKVLFLINSLTGGGAERVMCTLLGASRAESEEFDITFATLDVVEERYAPPAFVDRRRFDCGGSMARSMMAARSLMAELRPDAVVSFLVRANMINAALAPLFGARSIISERANTSAHFCDTPPRRLIGGTMVRLTYPRANRVIAVSTGVADDLADNFGVARERLAVIHNPIDIDIIRAKSLETPAVLLDDAYTLAVGRLTKSKNFDMLIEAFARSGIDGKLVILGVGSEEAALRAKAESAGVADRVMLPGFLANPYAMMRRARLFVLPSNAEGFPNGLVEAMATGAPVVSTNCPSGPSEILAERGREAVSGLCEAEHGVLVSTDNADEMAQALRLMQDQTKRDGYAVKAAARAADFSVEKAKNQYWDVVRAALAEPGRTRAALA